MRAFDNGFELVDGVERLQLRDATAQVTVENTGTSGVTASLALPLA